MKRRRQQLRALGSKYVIASSKRSQLAVQVTQPAWLTRAQVNASYRALRKHNTKTGHLIKVKCGYYRSITRKSIGIRMGKGKAPLVGFVAQPKVGSNLFEIRRGKFDLKRLLTAVKKLSKIIRIRHTRSRW